MNRLELTIDRIKKTLYRTHWFDCLKKVDSSKNKLLLLYRNPKELLIRKSDDDQTILQKNLMKGEHIDVFLYYLRFFDKWAGEKLLVYYEDLLFSPEVTLRKVLDFLKEDDHSLKDYLENIDEYRQKILISYSRQHADKGGSFSKGKDSLFHSKQISKKFLKEIDVLLKNRSLKIWEKYLKRFATLD